MKSKRNCRVGVMLALSGAGFAGAQTYKYDFGPAGASAAAGYTAVGPTQTYSSTSGYGFERSGVTCQDKGGDALTGDFCTQTGEFMFSVKIPQGNYHLTVHLGDPAGTSETTVKAENRRFLFDRVTTASGQAVTRTITVNRREARSMDGTVTMSLKDRELGYYTWDEKLTLRFSGRKPAVAGFELTKADNAVTWFLCGNSTVVDQMDEGWAAWGQYIPHFFKPGLSVANYAESGLTAPGFLSMRRLAKILADAKPGDYVAVEFGHNDQKNTADVSAYPANLKTFADQIRAKSCIPVFVTPTARETERDPRTSIGGLAQKMRDQAQNLDVALIDLNAMSIQMYQAYGAANTGKIFQDGTHYTDIGGYELARCVTKGIRELNSALTTFLADGPAFDPAKPDPVDFLTQAMPTSLRATRPGKISAQHVSPAAAYLGKDGALHSASGRKLAP